MHIEEKDEIYLQYLQKYFKLNEAPFYKKCILILEKYVKKMMFEGNQKSPHKNTLQRLKENIKRVFIRIIGLIIRRIRTDKIIGRNKKRGHAFKVNVLFYLYRYRKK